jgi:hypothetical protein
VTLETEDIIVYYYTVTQLPSTLPASEEIQIFDLVVIDILGALINTQNMTEDIFSHQIMETGGNFLREGF